MQWMVPGKTMQILARKENEVITEACRTYINIDHLGAYIQFARMRVHTLGNVAEFEFYDEYNVLLCSASAYNTTLEISFLNGSSYGLGAGKLRLREDLTT